MSDLLINNISFHDFVRGLGYVLETKDIYTAGHSERVAHLSYEISKIMALDAVEQEYIHIAGHLHDIGKIGIPDGILLKTGKLTKAEFMVMQQHSEIGANIFFNMPKYKMVQEIILYHHERFDGQGYPKGLKGDDIPIGAAIIAVADAFDAMTTTRSYRIKVDVNHASLEIEKNKSLQFHPEVVDAFMRIYKHNKTFLYDIIDHSRTDKKELNLISFDSLKK